MPNIAVFCSSRDGKKSIFKKEIENLANAIFNSGSVLTYGGTKTGLMGHLAHTFIKLNGFVTGVNITEFSNLSLEESPSNKLIMVKNSQERITKIIDLADAFIVFPGGIGSIQEFSELLLYISLKQVTKPLAILNLNNFYSPMIEQLEICCTEGFLDKQILDCLIIENNCHLAVTKLVKKLKMNKS